MHFKRNALCGCVGVVVGKEIIIVQPGPRCPGRRGTREPFDWNWCSVDLEDFTTKEPVCGRGLRPGVLFQAKLSKIIRVVVSQHSSDDPGCWKAFGGDYIKWRDGLKDYYLMKNLQFSNA